MTVSRILGTGHNLPERVMTNYDVMEMMDTSHDFIVKRTGVESRRRADPGVSATDLAVPACQAAVQDAGLTMDQIDLVIFNTITPDHADPGSAFFLQPKLGLSGIPVMEIRQQCAGLIYGLSIADHFVRADTYRHVLVVCSEVLSTRIDGSYDGRNIAILLGDGAGAVVVGPSDESSGDRGQSRIVSTILHADGSKAKALYTAAPGSGLGRKDHINKDDIDTGRVHFRMDGQVVFQNGVARMSEVLFESIKGSGLTMDDIDLLIPHQANLRMLEAIIEKTEFPQERVFVNVVEYGNMASACLPVALDQARRNGRIAQGDLVQLIAFGSGFVWGSALLQM